MDKIKGKVRLLAVFAFIGLLASTAIGLNLSVEIAESADYRSVGLDPVSSIQSVYTNDFTVENTGSLGCIFRARTVMEAEDRRWASWSRGYALQPGETVRIENLRVVGNYTGEVNTTVYLNYCEQTERLTSFNTEVNAPELPESSVGSLTASAEESSARVYLDQEADRIVPVSSPPLWKASHAEVSSRKADIEYSPPIFEEKEIDYYVLENGSIEGITTVKTSNPEGLRQRLKVLFRSIRLNL